MPELYDWVSCKQDRRAASSYSKGGSGDYPDPADLPGIPWVRSVLSGCDIMRNPKYNKGAAIRPVTPSMLKTTRAHLILSDTCKLSWQ